MAHSLTLSVPFFLRYSLSLCLLFLSLARSLICHSTVCISLIISQTGADPTVLSFILYSFVEHILFSFLHVNIKGLSSIEIRNRGFSIILIFNEVRKNISQSERYKIILLYHDFISISYHSNGNGNEICCRVDTKVSVSSHISPKFTLRNTRGKFARYEIFQ